MAEEFLKKFLETVQGELNKIFEMPIAVCKIVDLNGNVLFRLDTPPEVCKIMMSSEKGMAGCLASCGGANALVKEKDEAVLITCHAGFVGFYFPIVIEDKKLGGITGCLAMISEAIDEETAKEKYRELARNYDLESESLIKTVSAEFKTVTEKEKEKLLTLLKNTLAEIFKIYEIELKEALTV